LLSLLLLFVGTGASAGTGRGRAIEGTLMVLVIVAAVWDLRERGRERLVAAALGASAIVLSVLDLTAHPTRAGRRQRDGGGARRRRGLASMRAMRLDRPVGERILGAVCVYLLIGLAWAKIRDTGCGDQGHSAPGGYRRAAPGLPRYAYLSFITLATVGYGDVTPVTPIAGTLAWLGPSPASSTWPSRSRLVALSLAEGRGPDRSARS
jgi:hypothetical protein